MKIKASIKEAEEITFLGETVIKHNLKDLTALVVSSDHLESEQLYHFAKEWQKLSSHQTILIPVNSGTEISQLTFEAEDPFTEEELDTILAWHEMRIEDGYMTLSTDESIIQKIKEMKQQLKQKAINDAQQTFLEESSRKE